MKTTGFLDEVRREEENPPECEGETIESAQQNSLCEGPVPKKNLGHTIILHSRKLGNNKICDKQWFRENFSALDNPGFLEQCDISHRVNNKIPKYILSLDEKYLLRCLELMHFSAFGEASCNLGILPHSFDLRGSSYSGTSDLASLIVECPLANMMERVAIRDTVPVISTSGDWILGSITASKSMKNILSTPLLHQLGAFDSDVNVNRKGVLDDEKSIRSNYMSSPIKYMNSTPKKLKDMVLGDHGYESEPFCKRLSSMSSTNSTSSDQYSSSVPTSVSQGMLKCTWKNGFPNYVFSVDDHGEIYVANLLKMQSSDDKALDYIYTFHSKSGGKIENELCDVDLHFVGKMKVSTSVTLCPNNLEIMETQFVLFGSTHNWSGEMQTSAQTLRRNKGLTKKVADVFKTSHYRKPRTCSNLGTNTIHEDTSWEPSEDVYGSNADHGKCNLLEHCTPTNLELAAIVVKQHVYDKLKEPETGGWGLKFLKRSRTRQIDTPQEILVSSESCSRDSGECSTSMDILVPAGFHGGPSTSKGGPSSLIDRWKSGGHCDCGGWDIGCPLTIINTRSNTTESSTQLDIAGQCKSVDLFIKGSKQVGSIMKMTNIHKDLHYIHFQSTLSALQSFSIATAIIHSHSPALRPKLYRN